MHNLKKTTSLVSGLATDCTAVAAADDDDDDRSNLFTTVVILKKTAMLKFTIVKNSQIKQNKCRQT